jgi:hypothetical protein
LDESFSLRQGSFITREEESPGTCIAELDKEAILAGLVAYK